MVGESERIRVVSLPASRAVAGIYFVFGICLMAWVPRFAEIKTQVGVTNAEFGLLLSIGFVGSLLANLFMGHVAHRWGSKRVLIVCGIIVYLNIALVTHVQTPLQLTLMNICLAFTVTAFNVGLNAQSLLVQARVGHSIMGSLHGSWALGALLTGIVASFISATVSPQLHVTTLALTGLPLTLWLCRDLIPLDEDEHANVGSSETVKAPSMWQTPFLVWILAVGSAGGALIEFVNGDWNAIYANEYLGVPIGPHALLFTTSMVAMVVGRFGMDPLVKHVGIEKLVRICVGLTVGGLVFGIWASMWVRDSSPWLALTLAGIGFFVAGLGSAPMIPVFYGFASAVRDIPVGVALARMALGQQLVSWLAKLLIAAVVGLAGVAWGYMVPALAALLAGIVIRHLYRIHFVGHDDRVPVAAAGSDFLG